MKNVADELLRAVEEAVEPLRSIDSTLADAKPGPNRWSKKEILGHLIDSASNNHQRFVRAQQVAELSFPDYQQETWVQIQNYSEASWEELIEFWRLYNRHLARVIGLVPEAKQKVLCRIGPGEPTALEDVARSYLSHLRHHLEQLL